LKAIEEVAANNRLPSPAFVAGHSLGEYTALAAANVADFATIVYLARERGRLMHEAGLKEPGGMVAIIGMAEASLAQVCRETGTWVANINYPGQLVISGANQNLAKAVELARARGAHRAIPLAVSGAFHTSIMQPAVDGMRGILATLNFRDPAIPVVANTSASPLTAAEEIKDELIRQLLNCVRWQQSIENMIRDEVDTFIEVGPGKVLTGIIKRIDKNVRTLSIGDAEAVRGLGNSSISMTPFS
jgi:[acyl-carrier-protein] S-malonyltransferase